MPALNADPQRPRRNPPYEDEIEAWAMPLGSIGGIELCLSYSVFVAFAVLAGVIVMAKGGQADGDLPLVAVIGSAFWVTGWLVQVIINCFFRFVAKAPIATLTIGLLGIETPARSWSAKSALLVSSATLLAMIALGAMLISCESLVIGTRSLQSTLSVWTAPAFGLTTRESVWLAGAWLCWIQAICQMFPLPKSLGRVWLVSSVALLSGRTRKSGQVEIARRLLQVIATVTAIVAVASLGSNPHLTIPRWALLVLLAVYLWTTSRGSDIDKMLSAFGSKTYPEAEPTSTGLSQTVWVPRTIRSIRSIWLRRKARRALQQERNEAIDAAQLDQVLSRLHEQGIESLSGDDRALLNRVSQALRRQRKSESISADATKSGAPTTD